MYVDRRLAGIQAVQTLSRLNRAYPGKDTTFVLDFVNSSEEILEAFRTYYDTAELEGVTDPNLVFDLRAKLDATGYYDNFEVDRVAAVELNPKSKQGDLVAALSPIASRLLIRFKDAQRRFNEATVVKNEKSVSDAREERDALILFKGDMGAFVRLYTFLSQIFDYGNTDIEKRFIFYRRLIPLLEFGREREGIDLSKVVLTHHNLKSLGKTALNLGDGETKKLSPLSESGSGSVQEKEKALLAEIISKLNELFEGDLTDGDQLSYANTLRAKMLESDELIVQAANNSKAQFANSPTLTTELMNAIMDALAAHSNLSKQALDSERVRDGLKDVLLGPAQLWELLRAKGAETRPGGP